MSLYVFNPFSAMQEITRGIRNCNPFNIKKNSVKWNGMVNSQSEKTFCVFENLDYGVRAGIVLLRNYVTTKKLNDVDSILKCFCPVAENGAVVVRNYYNYVKAVCGSDIILLDSHRFYLLCAAICQFESKYVLTFLDFMRICHKFHILDKYYTEDSLNFKEKNDYEKF